MAKPTSLIVVAAIVAALLAAVAATTYNTETSAVELAKLYYEKSEFVAKNKTKPHIEPIYVDESKVAKRADVSPEIERQVIERVGVKGDSLGTYIYNETHLVTLVEEEFLKVYAIVWNNGDMAVHMLKFEKFIEEEDPVVVKRVGEYEGVEYRAVEGGRRVGYVDTSGVLPFATYTFIDEDWYQFDLPGGYFRVTARGEFFIVYGVAVYVRDLSEHSITTPFLTRCYFGSWVEGSGTPIAGVTASGRAITVACVPLGLVFEGWARTGYNAYLKRHDGPYGNWWLAMNCWC